MSASTEELLQQILELEEQIRASSKTGGDTSNLQDKLTVLKEQFQLMNETLGRSDKILRG